MIARAAAQCRRLCPRPFGCQAAAQMLQIGIPSPRAQQTQNRLRSMPRRRRSFLPMFNEFGAYPASGYQSDREYV